MSYYETYKKYKNLLFENIFSGASKGQVFSAINAKTQSAGQLLALLSVRAEGYIEEMAQAAHGLTLKHFGRAIQLYTPMYLSNYCDNACVYCGFNSENNMERKKLSLQEVESEAKFISSTGLRHILILTGDSRRESPPEYIIDCIRILKKYFSSISVEIYPLAESEYGSIVREGVDGLTIYQETYDEGVYDSVHKAGPKKDYLFRLDGPQRACLSGIRSVNIGVLLGLNDWRKEVFFMGLHAQYLQDKFSDVEIGVSIPRLRPHTGYFKISNPISNSALAHIICAMRIFMPRLGISISTRESAKLRDDLLPLGITRMSAGSTTRVGGHTIGSHDEFNSSQFEISDKRDVRQIKSMLSSKGYQPVLKDWMRI